MSTDINFESTLIKLSGNSILIFTLSVFIRQYLPLRDPGLKNLGHHFVRNLKDPTLLTSISPGITKRKKPFTDRVSVDPEQGDSTGRIYNKLWLLVIIQNDLTVSTH